MKITDNNYQLKYAMALEATGMAEGGANKPLFITALNRTTGESEEFVLKYRGSERMNEKRSARELIAAFLAMTFNIAVPEPAIVYVLPEFLASLSMHTEYANIVKGEGLNFGSQKTLEPIDIIPNQTLSSDQIKQATRIFVFDIIIQNADRNIQKPNMFLNSNQIHVIDHEIAFGFLDTFDFLRSANPWTFNETDVQSYKKHFFYQQLCNEPFLNLDETLLPIEEINEDFWRKVRNFVPKEWQTSEITAIAHHIYQIKEHLTEFKEEIWTKLLIQ